MVHSQSSPVPLPTHGLATKARAAPSKIKSAAKAVCTCQPGPRSTVESSLVDISTQMPASRAEDIIRPRILKKAWEKGGPLFYPRAEPHPRHARATPGHQPRRFAPFYGEGYLFSALWPILHRCRRYLFPSQKFKRCVSWQVKVGPQPPCCSAFPRPSTSAGVKYTGP